MRRFNAAIAATAKIALDRRRDELIDMRASTYDQSGFREHMRALTPKNDEIGNG